MANLTREEAWELVKEYNKDPFHPRHRQPRLRPCVRC